jgi:hypothetical protein
MVNIKLSDCENFVKESNGEKYLTFFVSKTKDVDRFKNTHTVYYLAPQEEPAEAESN